MPWSKAGRSRPLTALVALLVAFPALALPAHGVEPPFQLRFPQETEVTKFSSSFGAPRSGGRSHSGNDLMAPKSSEVYAAADGVIAIIGDSRSAGRYLEIDHGDGWKTRYLHLNNDTPGRDDGDAPWSLTIAPYLYEGSRVEAGQLIAWVGDSGNAEWTGSHTHFEIVYQDREIDPYPYLKAAFRRDDLLGSGGLWEKLEEWRESEVSPV